ncbi:MULTISPECIES: ribonuclease HII [Alteromonas]|uniref:Ribonuclease HII n=1 Tax=Alteromonas hispanica TaxID=315421 RepID=A0A6L9MR96_9ALTE|nr:MULTISPECIES: ribonuclease HII [Alteromonas]AUC87598.1 ribonuclease HII [Alteromonas sp. MB-3u-76]MAI64435.1 ribonuclease HII [Alteromonas sp.]NDW20607.1 ribonuclease HII [Alteromonas hispanica]
MDKLIAGVDEVGRGPLVGDVVTAAVILDPSNPIEGLNDSKKLSEKKRVALAQEIREKALYWNIGRASPAEIDNLNILHATMLAMVRAVDGLQVTPDFVRVDGNRLPDWNYPSEAIVKGDGLHQEISAASIIAKVERDNDMLALHEAYPQYNFAGHKGYPTKAHFAALAEFGVLDCYRKSFKPVKAMLTGNS